MSIKATNWVWGLNLPPTPKLILMALADEADDDGNCWPSIKRIARKACVSDRTVRRTIKEYGDGGILRVSSRTRNDGGQSSNRYTLVLGEIFLHQQQRHPPDNLSSPANAVRAAVTSLTGEPLSQSCQSAPDAVMSGHDPLHDPSVKTTTTSELIWDSLPQLDAAQRVVVANEIERLDTCHRQDVLDELAGALRAKAIKGQWPGWLHGVVRKAREGAFKPNHALTIQSERKQRRVVSAQERRVSLGLPPMTSIASREVAEAAMASIRSGLSAGDST